MKVLITEPAKESLKEICKHYRRLEFDSYAVKVRKTILEKAKSLSDNPERGQKEEMLKSLDQGHRYLLVESHFKIIYLIDDSRVIVTDIFDTHQHPNKVLKGNQ
jgi:plasmid stabilization system protein ParE